MDKEKVAGAARAADETENRMSSVPEFLIDHTFAKNINQELVRKVLYLRPEHRQVARGLFGGRLVIKIALTTSTVLT